jgi:hypothetical protein
MKIRESDPGPSISLRSADLLSKYGFNDGAAPEQWRDYLNPPEALGYDITPFPLIQVVRRYLLPALDQEVAVEEIGSCHNPVRAIYVDGVDVEDFWTEGDDAAGILTPEFVEVPLRLVELLLPFEGEIVTNALSADPARVLRDRTETVGRRRYRRSTGIERRPTGPRELKRAYPCRLHPPHQ